MIWIYRLLFPFVLLVLSPYYLLRMRRRGGYARGFLHRFGAVPLMPRRTAGTRRVWLQAVSVGEMLAIEPILRALKNDGTEVFLSTTTSTGYRIATDRYPNLVTAVGYFPIDWMPFSRRAWDAVAPDLAIITEGERWPEHLWQAKRRKVPVLCINARISDRSFKRLRHLPPAARFVTQGITRLLAGSALDAERFLALGIPADRVEVTGNIKLDVTIAPLDPAARAALSRELGLREDRLVLLGSSTWPGEEAALLDVLVAAREKGMAVSLLLVPRHAERRHEIEKLLKASALAYHFRSQGPAAAEVDIAVGDTTGELRAMTQLADLVFVGKSLPPHTEGQTPVEAATLGKAIIFGGGMANFRAIAQDLLARGAARSVVDAPGLQEQALGLLADRAGRDGMAEAASGWRRDNQGGVERTLAAIRREFARINKAG